MNKPIDQRQQLLDQWAGNLSAQRRIREWCKKAEEAHFDEGNYYVQMLQDEFGMVFDTRSGYDYGNLPDNNQEHE